MAARKPTSPAMTAYCAAVNDLGNQLHPSSWRNVRPRQLERWHQYGLLPSPERPSRGRGGGRAVLYTDEHSARAVEAATLARRHRSLATVGIVLFLRERPMTADAIRRSYLGAIERFESEIEDATRQGAARLPDPPEVLSGEDRADIAESVLTDRMRRSPRTAHLRSSLVARSLEVQASLGAMNRALAALTIPGLAQTHDAEAFTTAIGLRDAAISDATTALPDDLAMFRRLEPANLRAVVAECSSEDFERARASAADMRALLENVELLTELDAGFVQARNIVAPGDDEVSRALEVLGALDFEKRFGVNFTTLAGFVRLLMNGSKDTAKE